MTTDAPAPATSVPVRNRTGLHAERHAAKHRQREASAPTTRPEKAPAPPPPPRRCRFIAWHTASLLEYNNPAMRNLHPLIVDQGWEAFVHQFMAPLYHRPLISVERGDGHALHNPFGFTLEENMRADQAEQCDAAGGVLAKLVEEFPAAVRRITRFQGPEVIAYIGRLQGILQQRVELARARNANPLEAMDDALGWYMPAVKAGCSIGFDVMHDVPSDDPAWLLYRLLQSVSVRCYVEPIPGAHDLHMAQEHAIIMEDLYLRDAGGAMGWRDHLIPRERYSGNILRVMNNPALFRAGATWENAAEWLGAWVASVWDAGHNAAAPGDVLLRIGVPIDQLVSEARQR